MDGVLNVNKSKGITSRRIVDQVVRVASQSRVGHAGTLDPLASGVLVVCVGAATRLIECIQMMSKTYVATVRLGARSDTLDVEGHVIEVVDPPIPSEESLHAAIASQTGEILQQPPEYSALRVKGRRAHELARSGQVVQLEPRLVKIHAIRLLGYQWPRLELEIECGGGTYIRSIARDLGELLGCGGVLERLVRSRIGHFGIENAVDPASLTVETWREHLLPVEEAVRELPTVTVGSDDLLRAVSHGKTLSVADLGVETMPRGVLALLADDGRLVALARGDSVLGTLHPFKVMI